MCSFLEIVNNICSHIYRDEPQGFVKELYGPNDTSVSLIKEQPF